MSSRGPFSPLVTIGIAVIVIITAPYQLAVALWRRIRERRRERALAAQSADQKT